MSRSGLWPRIRNRVARDIHNARLRRSMRHIHGPKRFETGVEDVTVVALVRDGIYYLDGFFDYYRSIGVDHFVFVENGSDDGTVSRITREPGTIIVQSHLPWGLNENGFRRYAAETYCAGRWCLYADMDEQFDFEGRADIGLAGLVRYLDAQGYTALVAQMLEMFPKVALRQTADLSFDRALADYQYYDPTHIRAVDYHDPSIAFSYYLGTNTIANNDIRFLFGGVRQKVFGEDCALSKHPLVFVGQGVEPGVHPHCAAHVVCADFTALIRHYKFTNNPFGRDAQTVLDTAISHGEDHQRLKVAENDPDLTLYSDASVAFNGIGDLQQAGFLVPSARYSSFVREESDA